MLEAGGQDLQVKNHETRAVRIRNKSVKPIHSPESNFSVNR